MSKKHQEPLLLTLKPSRRLKQLLVIMHALALGSSLAAALTIAVKLALWAGLLVHLGFMLRHIKSQQHILKHTEEFGWELSDGADFESIQILDSTVISTFAIFLHFKTSKKQSLLIISDALTDDDYRQLIVRLKTQRE
jgi:toxin CptA